MGVGVGVGWGGGLGWGGVGVGGGGWGVGGGRTADHKGVIRDNGEAVAVEGGGHVGLRQGEADRIRDALAERPRRHLDARGHVVLRVSRSLRADLAELLEVGERDVVPCEVEHAIEESTAVSVGEDESVAVRPLVVLRVIGHHPRPEHVRHWSAAHGRARVSRVGLLHHLGGEDADIVDASLLEFRPSASALGRRLGLLRRHRPVGAQPEAPLVGEHRERELGGEAGARREVAEVEDAIHCNSARASGRGRNADRGAAGVEGGTRAAGTR